VNKLEGRVAVITGGSSGMALASAKRFVEEGAHVFITGRDQDRLDRAVGQIGSNVTGVRGDASDLASLDALFDRVREEKGQVDVLFASAGKGVVGTPLADVTEEHFDEIFHTNTRGSLFTVQKALPLLSEGASVILNGTVSANKGIAGTSVYSASKAALRTFVRCWAAELAPQKIRVNLLSPGSIGDTALFADVPGDVAKTLKSMIPLNRLGRSADIASAALFLASDDASFVTGFDLVVDGGFGQI
jgi:NAD(P)-dependent dehydrogenase (short-subunit alcohol dehydrogenase family)